MPDVRIVQNTTFPSTGVALDWSLLANGTLDQSHALETAIVMALGTDRLADVSDFLPNPRSTDRRGWWADSDADTVWGGWPVGSRLWLLARSKITDAGAKGGSTVAVVQMYLRECLTPFINARIISDFTMDVTRNAYNRNRIDAAVTIYRTRQPPIALRYAILWSEYSIVITSVGG